MKTSNVQTTHPMAIIRGWVDPLSADGAAGSGGSVVDVDVGNGGAVALVAGDVVVLQSDGTVAKTTTALDTRPVGVVIDDIAVGDYGAVAWAGPVDLITVTAAVTAGDYAATSTTAGAAQDVGATAGTGTFGYFTSAGTTPSGFLLGVGGSSGNFELRNEGGQDQVMAHGNMGATENLDPTDGNVHTGTLDANCVLTLLAPTGTGASTIELWVTQDGTGGRTLSILASGGTFTWDGTTPTLPTDASTRFRLVFDHVPGTTNDWIGNVVGSSSSSSSSTAAASAAHAHVASETHLSDGSTTSYTLDEVYEPGSVIGWNVTVLARLGVTETPPDQVSVSAAGALGDSIVFDYAATVV